MFKNFMPNNFTIKLIVAAAIVNAALAFIASMVPPTGLEIVDSAVGHLASHSYDLVSSSLALAISVGAACMLLKKL
jgi:hypothetical protein